MGRNPWKKLLSNMRINGRAWRERKGTDMTKEITVTADELAALFESQGRRCRWFGIELDPDAIFSSYNPLSVSVDRLDPSRGYHLDNIVICCRLANLGRGQCPTENFEAAAMELKRLMKAA